MKKILLLGCALIIGAPLFAAAPLRQVIVGPEDTAYSIAYNHGISTHTLIAANGLVPPYALFPGQVLVIPSPGEHIVGPGESLQAIAEEHGVKVDVLAQENRIGSPYFVKPGEVLVIPSRDTESLSQALTPAAPSSIVTSSLAPLPLIKTAPAPGETAAAGEAPSVAPLPDDLAAELAREKGVEPPQKEMLVGNLANKNEGAPLGDPSLATEEKPKKPVKEKEKKSVKKEQKTTEEEDKPVAKKEEKKAVQEDVKEEEEPVAKKETKKAIEEEKEDVKDVALIWPVDGKVISKFSPGKNDGINISVAEDSPVKAVASGEVMYAGNELKGFGNLLLLKHKDGLTTVYAHLSKVLVKKGDTIKQGQVIAKSGKTGDVKVPQLHFEVRMVKKAVDPLSKLEP